MSCRKALTVPEHQLFVVIDKADDAVTERDQQGHPNVPIVEISPEQRREAHRHQDQRPAHRRGPRLGKMALGTIVTNTLSDLVFTQLSDHGWPDQQ